MENKIQAKIITWLKQEGHYVFKVMKANRNGIPDLVGCTSDGRFFAIEVKDTGKLSRVSSLQEYNIDEIKKHNGIAFVADSLDTVIQQFKGIHPKQGVLL